MSPQYLVQGAGNGRNESQRQEYIMDMGCYCLLPRVRKHLFLLKEPGGQLSPNWGTLCKEICELHDSYILSGSGSSKN